MKIKTLEFENFKGIETQEILLEGESAIFVGANGSGKSTILYGSAILLSRVVEKITRKASKKLIINTNDIKNGKQRLKIKCNLSYENVSGSLILEKRRAKSITSNATLVPTEETDELIRHIDKKLNNKVEQNIPVLIYYPVQRVVLENTLHPSTKIDLTQLATYNNCFSSGADFKSFFEWYREQEDLENEIRLSENLNYQDHKLKAVREAIYRFMPSFKDLRIMRKNSKPTMVISKNNQRLAINQLSDGEKSILAMIGDLARRLAIANPQLENPLTGTGIVLIDEIELHLHPRWQRKIIELLYSTFPNIQFLISTHSPQVIGEAKKGKMYLMKNVLEEVKEEQSDDNNSVNKNTQIENNMKYVVKVEQKELFFGKDTNLILETLMNTHEKNSEVKELENNIYKCIAHDEIQNAKSLLAELIGVIGGNNISVNKLKTLITRREFLLKNEKNR